MKIKIKNFKKAQMGKITVMIIIIVAGILVMAVVGYFMIFAKSLSDTEACRLSALAKANARVTKAFESVLNLNCETDNIKVYPDKITKNSKDFVVLVDKRKDDQIKRVFADELYDCWYQLGAGNFDLFGNYQGGDLHCVICAYVDFDATFSEKQAKIENFNQYLSKRIPGSNQSYALYLVNGDKDAAEQINKTKLDLFTKKSYAIVYVAEKEDLKAETGVFSLLQGTGGAGIGAFILYSHLVNKGDSQKKLGVNIVSIEKVGELCEIMYG
ncbi:MAG: hypothetical protein Q8O89_05135 [Nanoarchaeota archaeon]|nr:hypothetical protein [Nanoarchaeota archaeon]